MIEPEDFPENGLVFWSIRSRDFSSNLSPGTIVLASVEEADHSLLPKNPTDRHIYRTEPGSVRTPSGNELCEILMYSGTHIQHPRELLGSGQFVSDHRPTPRAYVLTDASLFGPFSTEARPTDETNTYYSVNLKPAHEHVDVFSTSAFTEAHLFTEVDALVSLRPVPPNRSNYAVRCTYRILLEEALTTLNSSGKQTVQLKTPDQILRPLTKRFFQIGKFRSVAEQFESFVNQYGDPDSGITPNQSEVIETVRSAAADDKRLLRELVDGILESGFLSEMMEERLRSHVEEYVSSKSIELSTQIKESVQEHQRSLDAALPDGMYQVGS
jgi:hypothetical protein